MSDPKVTLDLQRLREAARLSGWGKTPVEFQAQQVGLVAAAFDHSDSLDQEIRTTLVAGLYTAAGTVCAQARRIDELERELAPPRR